MRAEVVDLGVKWSGGAPMPLLLTAMDVALLLCYEALADAENEHVMEVRFDGCLSARMGHPNDEVLSGHPLWGKGLKFYEAHLIHDSALIAEHRRLNSVHPYHRDEVFDRLNHYLLVFKDEVVEVLAQHVSARRVDGDMATEAKRAASDVAALL